MKIRKAQRVCDVMNIRGLLTSERFFNQRRLRRDARATEICAGCLNLRRQGFVEVLREEAVFKQALKCHI